MKNEGGGVMNCELRVTSYELQVMSGELHCGHSHRRMLESYHLKIQKSIVFCLIVLKS